MTLIATTVFLVISATQGHAQGYDNYIVQDGDGISYIAKRAGFTDFAQESRWNLIAQWNGYNNYADYQLHPGDTLKVIHDDNVIKPVLDTVKPVQVGGDSTIPLESTINDAAIKYGIRPQLLRSMLMHESGLNRYAISPTGDYGIAQINLSSHPDISITQAFDPIFSIYWAAENLRGKIAVMGNEYNALRGYNCGEWGAKVNLFCGVNYAYIILNKAK